MEAKPEFHWSITEEELMKQLSNWWETNPYEPKETFTRDEVKTLMDIARMDQKKRFDELIVIVQRGRELFSQYEEQKKAELKAKDDKIKDLNESLQKEYLKGFTDGAEHYRTGIVF